MGKYTSLPLFHCDCNFHVCLQGHKICEPCSEEEAVLSCPSCKKGFMGRDFGMEAFIRTISGED